MIYPRPTKSGYRVAQITMDGQGWIALLRGTEVVARFTDWTAARRAYRAATKA